MNKKRPPIIGGLLIKLKKGKVMSSELEKIKASRNEWRLLALQFDANRMEAIWLLRHASNNGINEDVKSKIDAFLSKPPLNGNVLYEKIVEELSS